MLHSTVVPTRKIIRISPSPWFLFHDLLFSTTIVRINADISFRIKRCSDCWGHEVGKLSGPLLGHRGEQAAFPGVCASILGSSPNSAGIKCSLFSRQQVLLCLGPREKKNHCFCSLLMNNTNSNCHKLLYLHMVGSALMVGKTLW